MELLQLSYFLTVARQQHMTRAAEELNITQPTLSSVISRLESELGVKLFDRTGRSIVLNSYGAAFAERASHILQEIDDAKQEIRSMVKHSENIVRAKVTSPFFASNIIPLILSSLDVTLQIQVAPCTEIIKELLSGRLDFAIVSRYFPNAALHSEVLMQNKIVVAAHKHHWETSKTILKAEDLADEKFVMLEKNYPFRVIADNFLDMLGIRPTIIAETDYHTRNDLLRENIGITLVYDIAKRTDLNYDEIRFLDIEGTGELQDIVLLTRKEAHLKPIAVQVIQQIKEYYRHMEPECNH